MVLFDLSTLRRMAADETVRAMFFLPQTTDLDPHSHVVLTSRGTVAAEREGSRLIFSASGAVFCAGETEACLYRRFSERFDLVPVDEADCLAVGEMSTFPRFCSSCGTRRITAKRGPSSRRNPPGNITSCSRR
jgi:hypothetical protein